MMHKAGQSDTAGPALGPCQCLSHPPIIVRPLFCQQLNQTIQQTFGIRKKAIITSESISASAAFQNANNVFIDRTKLLILDRSEPAVHKEHRSVNSFLNDDISQTILPVRSINFEHTQLSKETNREKGSSKPPPEVNCRTENMNKNEQSQDEFADLWADFDLLPSVISADSNIQYAPDSDRVSPHINANALASDYDHNNEASCRPRVSSDYDSAKIDLNDAQLARNYEDQQSHSVIRRYSTETITSDSKSPNAASASHPQQDMAVCRSSSLSDTVGIEMGNRTSQYQFGFSTASGKKIKITAKMLSKGEEFLKEDAPQTPATQTVPYRKRLKFTPVCRTLPSINKLPVPSPSQINVTRQPCKSVLSIVPRIALLEFAKKIADLKKSGEMLGYLHSDGIQNMTSTRSTSYSFPDGRTWNTVCQDLVKAGANRAWASEEWVKNHYRWVVWKLASMERRFDIPCLQYDRVFKQIHRRYQQEFISSRRSCLKMITEHDNTPGGYLVLCIASANYDAKTIELTDGWYSIFAELDAGLKKVLTEGKLYEGLKLRLFNCFLIGELSACTPLENTSMRLRLSINCTKRAPWNARLGDQQKSPFLTSLSSLKPNGGIAPKLRLKILRVMPTQYTEKVLMPSGRPSKFLTRVVVRNQIGEDAASNAHDKQIHFLQEILQEHASEKSVENLLTRIRSTKSISVELSEKIASELQDVAFERVTDILKERICIRPVITIHRYLVESAKTESNLIPRTYVLNVSNAIIQRFHIGDVITATQLDCSSGPYGSLTLSSTNRTQIEAKRFPSCFTPELSMFDFSCHDLNMGLFFDVSGLLVLRCSSSIVICSAKDHTELLIVQLGADWPSPKINVGQFIKIENLFYNRFDSRLNCHSTVGRGTASVCITAKANIPMPFHFLLQCRRASAIVDPINNPVMRLFPGARSISKLVAGNMELKAEPSFHQDFFGFILNHSSIVAKKELVFQVLDDEKDTASLTGRRVCVWISAEIESQNLLIAEAIELS